jgi:trigger factor
LPDLKKIKVDTKEVKATDAEVNKMLEDLQKMQPKETVKAGASTKEDKLVIDLDMFLDKVPVDGGQAKNHQVYLNEPHYIPGLAEQLVGLAKDDTKEFSLEFPKDHYQKHIAGKKVDFKAKVNEVYQLEYAKLDDEFAKVLGQESLTKLKDLLMANLTREGEKKENERQEIAILDQMIEKTTFGEIPQVLIPNTPM